MQTILQLTCKHTTPTQGEGEGDRLRCPTCNTIQTVNRILNIRDKKAFFTGPFANEQEGYLAFCRGCDAAIKCYKRLQRWAQVDELTLKPLQPQPECPVFHNRQHHPD